MDYPFEKLFLVCIGSRCDDKKHGKDGGECIAEELKSHNKSMKRKPLVRVCRVSCLDLCDHGPNMIVDGKVYAHLDQKKALAVYSGVMGDGPARPDLELDRAEFEDGTSAAAKRP